MERLIKARKNGKFQQIVEPGTMRFIDFATLQLDKGERHSLQTGAREYVLDIFSGAITLTINTVGHSKEIFSKIGERSDVFSGPPVMSYIPPNSRLEIKADSAADLGIFSAPSNTHAPAALMEGSTVSSKQVGRDNWQRTVYSALDENVPAERLLAGETLTPPATGRVFRLTSMTAPTRRTKPCWKRFITFASGPHRVSGLFGPTRPLRTPRASPMFSWLKMVTPFCCRRAITRWWPRLATNCSTPGCSQGRSGNMAPGLTTPATVG